MSERQSRNMVQRLDGRMVNAGAKRGMLLVCATGCCCGITERGYAPVPTDLYHNEWERRKLRNKVHLNQGGCLGPCPLANVVTLLLDGRPYWFHSLNDDALILALYDYIEALLATDRHIAPPSILEPHLFNGFAWDGQQQGQGDKEAATVYALGEGIVLLTQADTDLLVVEQARASLPAEFAPLRAAHIGRLGDDAAVDALLDDLLPGAAVVVARLHAARSFAHGLDRLAEWAEASDGFLICLPAVEALDPELMARSNVGVPLAHLLSAYFQAGGAANMAQGLLALSDHLLITGWGYEPPRDLPRHGLYMGVGGWVLGDGGAISEVWPPTPNTQHPTPTVGVLFYRAHLLSGNTGFVDALLAELAARGLRGRAVYTQSLKECDADGMPSALSLLRADGPLDAIISTLSFALAELDPAAGLAGETLLGQLDVPIIQAITASTSREQWLRAGRGLGPLDTAINVALPEFDGRIIGVPIAFKEQAAASGAARSIADPERISRLIGIVERQVALRRKPNSQKRIAFMLTNSSAKAQRIGNAVGLDAPASLLSLLHSMGAAGYSVGELPASSDALIAELIARCSYDETWLTTEQLAQAERVPLALYKTWFAELPAAMQEAMRQQWGPPPGAAYLHEGGLALAGIELGNTFVALQPPRGYDMDPNAIYHRPDLPPPHNYYALYRWLREIWQADAIVHVGKHGTLEWLPGKGIGLSENCFPDQFLADLPLIYPFIINDPGEGNQAKRRAHAVVVDHMTPPMTSAGSYGGLAALAQLVDEYYQTEQLDPGKLPLLQRQIWETIQKNRLDDDLRYILKADHGDHSHDWDGSLLDDGTPTVFAELAGPQVAHLLEDIEGYLCELTGAQIRDGLHILGAMPQGEQLVELAYHLLRLPNLHVPSLPAAVAACLGEDWAALLESPGERRKVMGDGCWVLGNIHTNADLIAHIEALSKALLRALDQHGWDIDTIEATLSEALGPLPGPTPNTHHPSPVLVFACAELIPKLRIGAHDEIANLLGALGGRYVPAGPSGAPTRGMAHVLPTGRNFYACDPRALPSMAAWHVGQGLADDLLRRYLRETGAYPTSVGISIWGTSAIRTSGDDIAQVLALLGVRPRWQAENRRVLGVEVIPLAELGRPRVDVVCRISGFFRDAFPHLIALIDAAVQLVAGLDESPEENYARRNVLASEAKLLAEGLGVEEAAEQARYRVFGCAPGSYGAGILQLIDGQNWQGDADFAEVYLSWGGYAYSATAQGLPARAAFAQALSGVQVATKNQDNREHDIFDSDDYLQFHGGMIATIRSLTGKSPARYFGDSSDPARPKTRDLREEARRVYRSRVVNPKWIASMQRHGYKGGLELAATVDYLFGYDATADVLEDWMYEQVAERYLLDPALQQFLTQSNPWALRAMGERMLEAMQRGMWAAPSDAVRAALHQLLEQIEDRVEGVE